MAAPNLLAPSNIVGRTSTVALTTSAQSVVNNPAASGKVFKINAIYVANIDGTDPADVTVNLYSQDDLGGTARKIVNTVVVPAVATLVIVSKDAPLYLEEDRSIGALASASGDLELICSYEEIS